MCSVAKCDVMHDFCLNISYQSCCNSDFYHLLTIVLVHATIGILSEYMAISQCWSVTSSSSSTTHPISSVAIYSSEIDSLLLNFPVFWVLIWLPAFIIASIQWYQGTTYLPSTLRHILPLVYLWTPSILGPQAEFMYTFWVLRMSLVVISK